MVNQGVSFDQINKIYAELNDEDLVQIPNKPDLYKNVIGPITKTKSKKTHGWPFKNEKPHLKKRQLVLHLNLVSKAFYLN